MQKTLEHILTVLTAIQDRKLALNQKDIEVIERIIYKNGDDIAVSIARSFERLEERIDGAESRIYSRLADMEESVMHSITGETK